MENLIILKIVLVFHSLEIKRRKRYTCLHLLTMRNRQKSIFLKKI